jgi:hypothetical protein
MPSLAPTAAFRLVLAATIALATQTTARAQFDTTLEWNRDVRPILAENCFPCHGPDKNKRKAELRLDTKEGLSSPHKHGVPVVAGDLAQSELARRITTEDSDDHMPPSSSKKTLTPAQIELLQRWIAQGAPYEGHWSFQPIRSAAPAVASIADTSAAIDAWVGKAVAAQHLTPSPEADRITLLRRLGFDLVGLPPTAAEAADFAADTSADAYERAVDRLLASPHFGERMATWWLDLVRCADTVGYHGDQPISVSPFRDHVIATFNDNQPFDQFTIEQLAGDLLPEPTPQQRIASGYNRLGMMSAEGGVQPKEYLAKYIAERVRNASGTWLGVTLGCAECHDHKFDPFTTRDFYRFEAFFADIKERGLYEGANDDGNWGPFLKVPTAAQQQRLAEFDRQIAAAKEVLATPTPALAAAQADWEAAQVPWTALAPVAISSINGAKLAARADGAILASDSRPETDTYELTFRDLPAGVTALRLEVLPDDSLPSRGPGRAGNGNFVLTEFIAVVRDAAGAATVVPLQHPTASFEQASAGEGNPYGKWAIAAALDGDSKGASWGWAVMPKAGQPHTAVFETATDLTLAPGAALTVRLEQNHGAGSHTLGCFRLAATAAPRPLTADAALPADVAAALAVPAAQRTEVQVAATAAHFRSLAPELQPVREQLAALERQRQQLDAEITSTPITEVVPPRTVRVLRRGNWMDESGDVVTAAFPAVLAPTALADRQLTRLDLARWLVSADNPLTARALANRLWKLLFGAGLSRRLDDLGAQGDWPSHPELLDLLAADLRDHGWDLKRLLKAIAMSRTYRQSSHADAAAQQADPYNRWLARQGRFRLEAEFVRDNALAVSGLLVEAIGGRSAFPYQPPGYWAHLNFPTREWRNGSGSELYRRGLYTHWQRQYLHPGLLAFDAPSREECTADRPRSNTPLQALVLLDDPSQVEAARALAELALQQGGTETRQRIDFVFRRALSRPATDAEAAVLEPLLAAHRQQYAADPLAAAALLHVGDKPAAPDLPPAEFAAWTSVTRTILNLHEFVTRN